MPELPPAAVQPREDRLTRARASRSRSSRLARAALWGAAALVGAPATLLAASPGLPGAPGIKRVEDPYRDFVEACARGFEARDPSGDSGGRELCECAAEESRHQKVKVPALKRETARISADPKAKIRDPGLLASLHYCTVQAIHQVLEE